MESVGQPFDALLQQGSKGKGQKIQHWIQFIRVQAVTLVASDADELRGQAFSWPDPECLPQFIVNGYRQFGVGGLNKARDLGFERDGPYPVRGNYSGSFRTVAGEGRFRYT